MCTILFAYDYHPRYSLVMAANRDEFYRRPTAAAAFWPENPAILAGKDLKEGGTWMGISTRGCFAALTNYRDPSGWKAEARSRGHIVKDFLSGDLFPENYLAGLQKNDNIYNDFNLLLGSCKSFYYYSSRERRSCKIPAGVHGLSNALLNTPWPKVSKGIKQLTGLLQHDVIEADQLFTMLGNRELPDDKDLPQTGIGLERERMLAPLFVASPDYGTRLSTVILVERNNCCHFWERSFIDGQPERWAEVYYRYSF